MTTRGDHVRSTAAGHHDQATRRTTGRRRTGTLVLLVSLVAAAAAACNSGSSATANGTAATTASNGGGATATTAAPARRPATKYAGFTSEQYAKAENWLCGPPAAPAQDHCLTEPLDATVVAADGATTPKPHQPAEDPGFDCFYVYPTVNFGATPTGTDDAMAADPSQELAVLRNQASRFSEVCKVYAPLYRQLTLSGFGRGAEGFARAYGDVSDAFKYYMANHNQGRPVLLIGHSQGSGMLASLLKNEFDNDADMRSRLVAAYLMGGSTLVPIGEDVGGSLQTIPACRQATQTACVVGFNSVSENSTPEDVERWGGPSAMGGAAVDNPNLTRLCTNPASLAGGSGSLKTITPTKADLVQGTTPTTPFEEFDGALVAECRTDGNVSTLLVKPAGVPGDVRNTAALTDSVAGWGLHISEANLVLGNLIDLARQQGAKATGS